MTDDQVQAIEQDIRKITEELSTKRPVVATVEPIMPPPWPSIGATTEDAQHAAAEAASSDIFEKATALAQAGHDEQIDRAVKATVLNGFLTRWQHQRGERFSVGQADIQRLEAAWALALNCGPDNHDAD